MRHTDDRAPIEQIFQAATKFETFLRGDNVPGPLTWDATMVADLAACSEDPNYFARNVMIPHISKGYIRLEAYPHQRAAIDHIHANNWSHVKHARQMGISTALAAYILWTAMFTADATILILGPSYVNATELIDRIQFAWRNLPEHLRMRVGQFNKGAIEFENGSKIFARACSGDAVRGMNITHLFLQDFGLVSHSRALDFWTRCYPVVASGRTTKVCMFGCPKVPAGLYYEIDQGMPENGFAGLTIRWDQHPDWDEAWKKTVIDTIGQRMWRREYECVYVQDLSTSGS